MSLPSWERGLKSVVIAVDFHCVPVAPLVGARIEICPGSIYIFFQSVAPLVGARIEIIRL